MGDLRKVSNDQIWPPIHASTLEALSLACQTRPIPDSPSLNDPRTAQVSDSPPFIALHAHNDPHRPGESIQFNIDSRQHDFDSQWAVACHGRPSTRRKWKCGSMLRCIVSIGSSETSALHKRPVRGTFNSRGFIPVPISTLNRTQEKP